MDAAKPSLARRLPIRVALWAAALGSVAVWVGSMWFGCRVDLKHGSVGIRPGGILWIEGAGDKANRTPYVLRVNSAPRATFSLNWPRVHAARYDYPVDSAIVLVSAWALELPLWLPTGLLVLGAWVTSRRRKVSSDGCRTCGYCLRGNVSGVCPECGTPVTQHNAEGAGGSGRVTRAAVHVLLTPWIVLPLLWGSLVVMLCTPVAAFLAIVAAAFQARRRRWAAVVALGLLSPMGIYALLAISDYARGIGKLSLERPELREGERERSGLRESGPEYPDPSLVGSIHPTYRCELTAGGWRIEENKWATEGVYNAVLMGLIRGFGPMRGSYTGPFPSRDESIAAGKLGQPCSPEELVDDEIQLGDSSVRLYRSVEATLLCRTGWSYGFVDKTFWRETEEYLSPIRVAMCRGCLIIRLPEPDASPGVAYVLVVDPERGRPFACYFENTRGMPMMVRWRE